MIDLNMDFIDAFIPSKDTRAYLHSIHHEFSDLEKATIVANHLMVTYDDKIEWLMDFKDRVSSEDLRERILNAVAFIKSEKESYDKGWSCDYNEALFDFVFIPHDFRHGDLVRSLYGEWNTIAYCEKIGIILRYFDKEYDFYRNMKGDYSDVQITVDTKFDGVKYQGEFSHEHINPIYIERMTLQEKDERRPYLDYLINIYAQHPLGKGDTDKPEYTGGPTDRLEQRHLGKYLPVYDEESGLWCVQTSHGFERGSIDYIAAEFSGAGLIYHFSENGQTDHVHGFDAILQRLVANPDSMIEYEKDEYSRQEAIFAESVMQAIAFVKTHHRPMTNEELRENRDRAKNHFTEEKSVMVLTVIYPYDTVEVLGVFDDKTALKRECIAIIGKDKSLIDDISNLHIYECPLNKMIGVFYPDDYDNADSIGSFFEEQKDISAEILGEEFLAAIRERQASNGYEKRTGRKGNEC